ncbi:hypothetical protein ABMA27_014730 [Loxostege sticticalis]|uniref:Fucosyltransferase n=1 Tax=Loxostege sticticalis TaxID=481309 RepID=A0ABR3IA21_LOXSC
MAFRNQHFRKTVNLSNQVLKRVFLIAFICFMLLHVLKCKVIRFGKEEPTKTCSERSIIHRITIEKYYEKRKHWVTSNLGSVLFKNQPIKYTQQKKTFTVLTWNHPWWPKDYIKNPLNTCSVKNCVFTYDNNLINTSRVDAVVVTTYRGEIPLVRRRNKSQRWVFFNTDSPIDAFINVESKVKARAIRDMADVFNWSMTYRSDSDVPIPYGRTVPLTDAMMQNISTRPITEAIPYWEHKQKDVLAVAMISNCNNSERLAYINELQKYIKVNLFGKCAKTFQMRNSCPRSKNGEVGDCPKLKNYLFYLAFENSKCRQYITEKVFHNAFSKGAIPVVMGAPVVDYEKLLPPNSFLHVNSFNSPRELAMEIIHLSTNDDYIKTYHKWRQNFEITNEHGSFGRVAQDLCRLCEALNYNDKATKVYDLDTLRLYLDPKLLCSVKRKNKW